MNRTKSIVNRSSESEQESVVAEDPRTRINRRMVQNVLLVWLDTNIDENKGDCYNTHTELQCVVNTFTDVDQCIDFLIDADNEKVFMVIRDTFCQNIIPLIHEVPHLQAIFIFSTEKTKMELRSTKWCKIQGVFTDISHICEAIKYAAQHIGHNDISFSFIPTTDDISKENLDQLDCSFMYTQILKEILLTIKFDEEHFQQFTDYCRQHVAKNNVDLQKITKFEEEYYQQSPIWWYTSSYFLYSMLNRALRTMDTALLVNMGFYIVDLHLDITKLHSQQFSEQCSPNTFILYRGQGITTMDFNQMMKNKGGLMAFNNFLSTSTNRGVSLLFAESNQNNLELVGVLFVLTIDPCQSTTPFASISNISNFDIEEEVLFSMHSIFRIQDIKSIDEKNHVFQVDLTLTSDNDEVLRVLSGHIRKETDGFTGWDSLGELLCKTGQFDKAEEVYQTLFDRNNSDSDKATIYNQLGSIKSNQGYYQKAITFYEKSLEVQEKSLPLNHPNIAISFNNIAVVYDIMSDYSKALVYYKKSLEIQQKSLPPSHPALGDSYNNIASVYSGMDDYSKALSFYEKSLEIRQKLLPPSHPALGDSYNNIASVYSDMGDYSKALSFHEKSLEIQQKSLPPSHPALGDSYNNIASVYSDMGDYSKALSFHEKSLEIQQKSLPPSHSALGDSYNNIASVYSDMGDYSKALSFHEKSLEIQQKSLPPSHPALGDSYNNIASVYSDMGDYSKALSFHEKSLEIQQKSLPPSHSALGDSYNNIASVYSDMGDYSKALSFYKKSLAIRQKSLPPSHSALGDSYNNIASVYSDMGDYSKALSFYKKSLAIRQKSLPPSHSALGDSYNNIASVYSDMGDYSKALSFYEKSLAIQQKSFPLNHPDMAGSYNNIALVYDIMGDYSKARLSLDRAVIIAQQSLPSNHPLLQLCKNNLEILKQKF